MKWIIEHWLPLTALAIYLIGVGVMLYGFHTAPEQPEQENAKDCGGYWN